MTPGKPRLRLHLSPAAVAAVRRGHPWVFAERIREINRAGAAGDIAALYDTRNRFLGLGLYDPDSPLRVRVLHCGPSVEITEEWWAARLHAALDRRASLQNDPSTTGYRWIHGESDGWPGLVLDRYGNALVLKVYTSAWLPRLDAWTRLLCKALNPATLVLRLSRNIAAQAECVFGRREGDVLYGTATDGIVTFLENGIRFEADLFRGQKTGFYLDQRENRARLRDLARGADVLNAFSFSAGFSLYAAAGGARSVTDIDISAHALESGRRNFALNATQPDVARARRTSIQADAFDWLADGSGGAFDIIVLDPPSLARREAERPGALRAYARLAESASRRLKPGGLLLAASCSAHVSSVDFFAAVREGVHRAKRAFAELMTAGQPLDHPATFSEARYLKAIYLRLR